MRRTAAPAPSEASRLVPPRRGDAECMTHAAPLRAVTHSWKYPRGAGSQRARGTYPDVHYRGGGGSGWVRGGDVPRGARAAARAEQTPQHRWTLQTPSGKGKVREACELLQRAVYVNGNDMQTKQRENQSARAQAITTGSGSARAGPPFVGGGEGRRPKSATGSARTSERHVLWPGPADGLRLLQPSVQEK